MPKIKSFKNFEEYYVATVALRKQWSSLRKQCFILKTLKEQNTKKYQSIRSELVEFLEQVNILLAQPQMVKKMPADELQPLAETLQEIRTYLQV